MGPRGRGELRRRRLLDLECWNLWRRGRPLERISRVTGATVGEAHSAIVRVERGRRGEARP